jgi:hypothetical protein
MRTRGLNRRVVLIVTVAFVALVVIVLLLVNKGNLSLIGTAGRPSVVDAAYTALSAQLSKTVTANNSVYTWTLGPYPDASLGCPQPGASYAPNQTQGYKVTITFEGVTYDYRAMGDGSGLFLCTQAGTPATAPAGGGSVAEPVAFVDAVFADLNARLGTNYTRANSHYTYYYSSYPDSSLGCPQTGKTYAPGAVFGWQIVITPNAGGNYDYRGFDEKTFWACSQ